MPQNSQPMGLPGWREAISVPTTPRTSGSVAYRTVSKASSRPAASGTISATSRTVTASSPTARRSNLVTPPPSTTRHLDRPGQCRRLPSRVRYGRGRNLAQPVVVTLT
jgi:hypothetical protein